MGSIYFDYRGKSTAIQIASAISDFLDAFFHFSYNTGFVTEPDSNNCVTRSSDLCFRSVYPASPAGASFTFFLA